MIITDVSIQNILAGIMNVPSEWIGTQISVFSTGMSTDQALVNLKHTTFKQLFGDQVTGELREAGWRFLQVLNHEEINVPELSAEFLSFSPSGM